MTTPTPTPGALSPYEGTIAQRNALAFRIQAGPPMTRLTKIITLGHTITMMPVEAESYDWPALMAGECQRVADYYQRPVSFSGRESGDRHTFIPTPDNP